MLFSGGGPSNKPKKEEKREKKSDRDDKYEVQEAVFTRWANSLFDDPITEIKDIVELSFLQAFTKLITGKIVSISGNRYDDIDVIIHVLASDDDDKILALSVPDLCEGNVKQLLILCNSFINMYWRRFAPQEMGDRKISEAIRDWCLEATAGYDDVCVNDFTSSWRDGMALNILLHSYDSNIVDMNAVRDMRGDERLENALSMAKRYFKVPKLILSKEFHSEHLDSKSVLCYLMMLYIAMACYSNSQSSSSKKSSRSSDITRSEERPPETLQPPKESTILELSPSTSVQSSTHSSAPSSSTNVTVIHKTDPMQQSTETISDVNIIDAETRSRHSSASSSRKSSRKSSRSNKNENVLKEYERCLEKVLAWLLEADEELNSMEPVNESDVDTVKNQFRDHEQFMLSLTESKDKVGRVLHEGQKLVDELPEEEGRPVNDQLLLVNQRWEDVRCQAMLRQQALQIQLNKLQKEQLQQICGWLSGVEGLIEDRKTLSSDIERCRLQITEHTVFEEQIEKQQQAIKKLSSYMAVVSDESVDDDDYMKIESLLKEVGERWDRICSWTEKRAQNLDGICDLLKEYEKKFTHLSAWLTARQEELVRLRSAHHLTASEEVEEQKKLIKDMDEALQKEHPYFVELSRLSTDLRNRYKLENQEFTEKIIKDFDSVTQRWENIVSRLEEHSQMLNRVKLNARTISSQSDSSAQGESSREEGEARLSTEESDEVPRQHAAHSEETISIVELFIEKTKQFEASLKPLAERLKQLKNPTKQQFTVIADEFKTQLAQVEELDALAEKVHQCSMNQAELHIVNENHERAMMFYGRLVNEFTERIKYMQNPNASSDDTAKVELHLKEWIDMANALWKDITNTTKEARGHRIDAFLIELLELQKKFSDFKAANHNTERFRPLENQLIELQQKARREKEREKEEREKAQEEEKKEEHDPEKALEWIRNVIVELKRFNLNSGDIKHLKDLEQTLKITSEQLKGKLDVITDEDFVAETEKVVNMLKKTTEELNLKINTIENIIHKAVTTEQLADKFERRLADLKRGQFELRLTESESRKLRDELFQHNGQKTKAIRQMDEMLQICQSNNEVEASNVWKARINKLEGQWKTLENDVEEYISVVAKNYRKNFQNILAEQEQLSNQLREAMIASGEATDAEELSEHVDNMEYLLEKLTKSGTEEMDPFQQYNLTNDTYIQREIERVNVQRKHIIDLAKERCTRLQEAISKCEIFEKDLCNFQSWCQHMNHILNKRLSQDINALDIPHEYKKASAEGTLLSQMNTEFSDYDVLLRSLGEFIEESKSHWSSSDRLKLQKNHVSAQLEELKGRFNLFKKPVQFEKSLESIEKVLQNAEESLDDLAGVKAENCEYCQIHISQTMKQVASCQEELIDLENKKDALVQEGIFDEEQAIIADQRLETALRKTQVLDARAVNDMERLQQSAQLVKKYEAEKNRISKNIRAIEDKAVNAPDNVRKNLEDAVAGIKKALELKAVLHQNSVRLTDSELDEYDRKVQILRNKYGSLLTSDTESADHLKSIVNSLERSVNMLERNGDKKQKQQVREKLVNINRRLLNSGDEIRKELGPKVAQMNSRISELERESRSITRTAKELTEISTELHEPVLPPTAELNSDNFEECVLEFLKSSKSLSSYLNFKKFSVEDTTKWVQRVKIAGQVSASNEEYREKLVKFGREWAEKGRMELSDQQILDYLDESDALTTKNSEKIQNENELLNEFETLEEMTNNCLTSSKQNIAEIHKMDLTDQLNVLKAQDELEAVNEGITESLITIDKFSQNAPGREKIFQVLYDKISELQVETEYTNASVRQALTELLTTTEQLSDKEQDFKKKPVHPDRVSMSSGAGLSLAMDVQETEGEEYFSDAARNQNKIRDVFNDLDTFEDFFDTDESLPFEGIDEKDQYLNTIEQRLREDKKMIKQMQMNMDVNEYEHTMGRFKGLSQNLLTRRENMKNNRSTIDNLFSFFSQAEEEVLKLDNIIRQADKNKSKDHSVDLEDWEAGQLETENLIPSLAVHIQQCENRYHNLKDKLSASLQNEFESRLANLNDDFNLMRHSVENNRMILEDKLADERYLLKNMNKFSIWCDDIEKFLNKQESFLDPLGLDASYELMKHRQTEVDEKILAFRNIEMLKDRFVALGDVDTEVKHRIRREITQLAKRISDLQLAMTKQAKELADLKEISDEFWTEVSKINKWVQDADVQVRNVEKAHLYKPMLFNLKKIIAESSDLKLQTQLMQRQVAEELLELKAPNEIHHQSGKTLDTVAKNFNNVTERARELLEGTQKEEQIEKLDFSPELELQQLESPPRNYNGRDDSTVEYGTLTNRDESLPPASMKGSGSKSRTETEEFHDALDRPLAEAFDDFNCSTVLDDKFSPDEKQRQEKCIQINGRMQEIERSISTTVNITDQSQIRQLISDSQNFLNEIGVHKMELQRILDQTEEQLISSRAIQCLYDLEKILESCKKRKLELTEMLHQTRLWEQLRSELELWLTQGNEKLMATERVNEMDEATLEIELKSVNDITGTIDNMKDQMEQLNLRSNEMIDKFIYDDNHTLSQLTSKLNTQWTKFNESLCIRRAVLEASLRSRNDIHTTLTQLDGWLNKQLGILKQLDADTENKQRLKDTSKRRDWMGQERESNAEIEAHRQVITSVRDMCKNLLNVLEADKERQTLQNKLEAVEAKWFQINELDSIVRERIQNAQDECEKLTKDLSELLHWTDMQISTILHDQPVGGDLTTVQQQSDTIRKIERQFDSKNREVADCIQLSHSYLMQHDLRPMIHRGSVFDASKEMEKSDAQLEERRIGVQILADSEKLKSSYDALKQHLSAWQRVVATAYRELQELDTAIAESLLAIGTIENEMDGMKLVEDLRLEELKEAKVEHAILKKKVQDTAVKVDDVNDCTGQIAAQNIVLSPHMETQIQTVNARYEKLSKEIGIRGAALERAFTDFGPSSEHFLSESVQPPWQRSISVINQMPYYVDHVTENTQWDHPSMVDIFEKLCTFNQVKFSAYRTAMKLRALQKHMCLDLIDLPSLDQALHKYRNAPLDEKVSIEDVVMTLVPLFETAHQKYPQLLRNVPLAVDLALNLLLNIYDPCRDGKLRTVSFAIAMVVLCNATLESKYKFLFSLITRDEGVDHKQLGLLFYDLIHITKLLGEAAVFGGSNIEPSVRSCFEYSKYPAKLSVDQYLSWLKKEPQSLVWLPVMHRLASSEFAKHQAKCNACKMFPIVGMRYRCLRCFNYDICQNCFFSQRTSKSHKLTHPMQEYCTPTKSKDDVRDFTLMVKNKMRRSRSKRGYLPVDTVDEGLPLENNQNVPQNPATETIHQRVQVFSQRLLKRQQESISATNVQKALQIKEESKVEIKSTSKQPLQSKLHKSATDGPGMRRDVNEIKSPSQLIKQVEQMHKEEMDQLLQKLQYENSELRQAVERKRHLGSTPNLEGMRQSGPQSVYPLSARHTAEPGIYASTQTMPHGTSIGISQPHPFAPHRIVSQPTLFSEDNRKNYGRSASSLPRGYSEIENFTTDQRRLLDAKSIRIHEHQLEERSRTLEEQNKQLQIQLDRLQRVVDKQTTSEFTRPIDTPYIRQEHGLKKPEFPDLVMYGVSSTDEDDTPGGIEALKMRRNRMDSLMNTMNELNRAMEYFVGSMLHEEQDFSDQYSVNMPQDG